VWLGFIACVLATGALVVGIIGLSTARPQAARPPAAEKAEVPKASGFDDDVDRSLCLAIAPLMRESEDLRNAFINSGPQNSPERKAAVPKFQSDVYDWQKRFIKLLNERTDQSSFLSRVIQRYVDDSVIYAEILAPDRDSSKYEIPAYDLGVVDYSGPLGRCWDLDAGWHK
jgi:hypothetical protein